MEAAPTRRVGRLPLAPALPLVTTVFDREENVLAEPNPQTPETPQGQPAQAPQPEIVLDDRNAHVAYANFARVTATPEELIMDLALNPNPFNQGKQDIQVTQRLIMNFYTAKRLLIALHQTIQRHEQTYGSIELDLRRRVNPAVMGAQQQRPPQ